MWIVKIGGSLNTNARVYARVIFGPFTGFPGQRSAVVWITDHARAIGTVTVPPATTVPGPVI